MGRRWSNRPPRVRNRRDDALANLDPYEFEGVVADYYRRQGYQVDHCGGRGRFDGGIDLKMYRDGGYVIVQCKRENANQVTHNVGHELLGVLLTEKADRAIVVNAGEFTPYAIETAAKESRLELIDGDRLREMLPEYAQPVPAPEPSDDLDRYVFSVPEEARAPALEPMLMPRTKGPSLSKAKRSRPIALDRDARNRPSRHRGHRSDGTRAIMALAMLAGVLVWQCSREPPRSSAYLTRGPASADSIQTAPPSGRADSRPDADVQQQVGASPSARVIKPASAPRTPEESRRRADEAMRVLAPHTPEFEPLPGTRALNREER